MPYTKKACFFELGRNVFYRCQIIEYLANDIRILRDLGYEVVIADLITTGLPIDCDLYFSWGFHRALPPLTLAKLRNKPHILAGNVHAVGEVTPGQESPQWVNYMNRSRLERWMIETGLRHSDATLATSKIEFDGLTKLRARNLCLVYHGIDTDIYRPPLSNSVRQRQVLTVTHLKYHNIKRKKIREIIASIPLVRRRFPDVKFVILGGWRKQQLDEMNELRTLAKTVGAAESLIFPGDVDRITKLQYYHQSSVYLQPTQFEGFGVAIAEAMACELPVITSPVGAVPEVVGDCGVYPTTDTPEQLAEHICNLLDDEDKCRDLGSRGRERVMERFSYARRKECLGEIIEGVV